MNQNLKIFLKGNKFMYFYFVFVQPTINFGLAFILVLNWNFTGFFYLILVGYFHKLENHLVSFKLNHQEIFLNLYLLLILVCNLPLSLKTIRKINNNYDVL